ncbi:MAG: Arc family DNA-binding protein [Clostridium sp.]|nr:Arc family DNA-binding protein [Clostridium sp.]
MQSKLPQYSLRVPKELLDKLKYIAEYNARSSNRELEMMIRKHIEQFEKEHGEILQEDIDKL